MWAFSNRQREKVCFTVWVYEVEMPIMKLHRQVYARV